MSVYRHKRHNDTVLLCHLVSPAKYLRLVFDAEVPTLIKTPTPQGSDMSLIEMVATARDVDSSRRQILRWFGVASSVFIAGCGGGEGQNSGVVPQAPATTPSQTPLNNNPQPQITGPVVSTTVNVSASIEGQLPADFTGLSTEKKHIFDGFFSPSNNQGIGLYRLLGASLLRIGGNSVDTTTWTPSGAGLTTNEVAPSDIDALAAFISATGWKVLYGVNLAQSTPALAAAEVAYVVKALGDSLYGIEIGNEPDLYKNVYFSSIWKFADYLTLWQSFATAIRQSSPHVPLTGPAAAQNIATYFQPFAETVGSQISLLTKHYYRGNGAATTSTVDALLSYPDTALQNQLSQLFTISQSVGIPFRMAETNSFYGGGASGVSNSYASSLWMIDHVMTSALGGASGVNFHGGGSATGYTQYVSKNNSVIALNPEFYGLKLLSLAGSGALLATTISANGLNVSAYSIQAAQGAIHVILVNKDSTQNLSVSIMLPIMPNSAALQVMQGPLLNSTENPTIQGGSIGLDGSFTPNDAYSLNITNNVVSASVPAASAVVIRII